MYDTSPNRELSARYCGALRDHVILMTKKPLGLPEQRLCLSSHLCPADVRIRCANVTHDSVGDSALLRNEMPHTRRN